MEVKDLGRATLVNGDCREVMGAMPENSVDAIVCDPPYGLSFMGKGWDHGVPGAGFWTAALRVAKPGAYLLAFGGTRTHHRLMCAIEDAGWELRDVIMWVYGSGFPKSHNGEWGGTALKPAWEPIILARKACVGTVAENVAAHGTGGLNIDGCRVETAENLNGGAYSKNKRDDGEWGTMHAAVPDAEFVQPEGRWPANLIHDGSEEVLAAFPESNGSGPARTLQRSAKPEQDGWGMNKNSPDSATLADAGTGSAARFFYCAKASKADRETGNKHPTVKPTDLMRYLCRLVTPADGVVLDPFMGSGSTGKAAALEGFRFLGVDSDTEHGYFNIACARVQAAYGAS